MSNIVLNESCIGLWEQQLEDATNQLAIKNAEFYKQNAAFNDLCIWVDQLQNCLESMDETDKKRDDILDILDLFLSQTESVCENLACLKEGIEILYCDIIQTASCIEELQGLVESTKADVQALQKNITIENSSFFACLVNLQTQIEKVLEMYEDMINQVLDGATTVYLIDCLLCDPKLGILNKLTDLISYFGGEANEDYCTTDDHQEPGESSGKPLCEDKLDCPSFPLAGGDYYSGLNTTLAQAETVKNTCKVDLDELIKDKDKLEACTSSLQKAIDEAKKAKEAK